MGCLTQTHTHMVIITSLWLQIDTIPMSEIETSFSKIPEKIYLSGDSFTRTYVRQSIPNKESTNLICRGEYFSA